MDNADQSMAAYEALIKSMPSIGFLSRKKRAIAFLKVTQKAQEMIDKQDISEDNALFLISVMTKKTADFQKAAMMAAMNLGGINRKHLPDVGFKYANQMRANLQMLPIDDIDSIDDDSIEEK